MKLEVQNVTNFTQLVQDSKQNQLNEQIQKGENDCGEKS